MDLAGIFSGLISKAEAGTIPEDRTTVEACGTHAFFAVLTVYMTNGQQGGPELAAELDHLMKALKNSKDPIVRSLGTTERAGLFTAVNMLSKQKEALHGAQTEVTPEVEGA